MSTEGSTALKELQVFQQQGAHLLTASMKIDGLSPFHAPVVEHVFASLNPADGDIYPHEKNKKGVVTSWRLTGLFLQKLSVCAGVRWSNKDTHRSDPRNDRDYVSYQAVGYIAKPDGSEVGMKGEYDVDMEVITEEVTESYRNKARDWAQKDWFKRKTPQQQTEYIDYCIRRDVMQKRKHKLKLAETGAKNRAIRALLGLKNAYTPEELQKPFVMVRIIVRPDYTDPDVKKAMLAATVKSITGIYHEPSIDDAIDVPFSEVPPAPPEEPGPEPNSQETDFENSDPETQVRTLCELVQKKGYDMSKLPKPPTEMGDRNRLRFFQTLIAMPDAAPADGMPG